MTILDKIINRKIEEVAERKLQVSVKELEMKGYFAKTTNSINGFKLFYTHGNASARRHSLRFIDAASVLKTKSAYIMNILS